MERKISSPFTEFFKVYTILGMIVLSFIIFGLIFSGNGFPVFLLAALGLSLFLAFDYWRMKEVEMTDAGLIVTERFFFTQKSIFVPFEQIESVNNSLWWLGNKKRTTVKFLEETEFGKEIVFVCRGFTRVNQAIVMEELKRAALANKSAERLDSAPSPVNLFSK